MEVWNQKIFNSDRKEESNFIVSGIHHLLGQGTLSTHKNEWHATYNSMLINADGGKSIVESI